MVWLFRRTLFWMSLYCVGFLFICLHSPPLHQPQTTCLPIQVTLSCSQSPSLPAPIPFSLFLLPSSLSLYPQPLIELFIPVSGEHVISVILTLFKISLHVPACILPYVPNVERGCSSTAHSVLSSKHF